VSKLIPNISRLTFGALAAAVTVGALPGAAQAGAFYLQEQSVRGLGRAYSGEVTAKGADELWWNPAAIAGATRPELYVGVHGLLLSTTVNNTGTTVSRPVPPAGLTTPVGGDPRAYDVIENGGAPNLAYAMPLGDRFAVALSVHAPFNFTTNYNRNSWARYEVLKTHLPTCRRPWRCGRPTGWTSAWAPTRNTPRPCSATPTRTWIPGCRTARRC
jgi:long-chain fatty acid transport protein